MKSKHKDFIGLLTCTILVSAIGWQIIDAIPYLKYMNWFMKSFFYMFLLIELVSIMIFTHSWIHFFKRQTTFKLTMKPTNSASLKIFFDEIAQSQNTDYSINDKPKEEDKS